MTHASGGDDAASPQELERDREAFRAALLRLLDEPGAARVTRSARARAFARETFDPSRQVTAYLDLFERVLRAAP